MFFRGVLTMAFAGVLAAQTTPRVDAERQLWKSIHRALADPDVQFPAFGSNAHTRRAIRYSPNLFSTDSLFSRPGSRAGRL
jgi:hypothetical protein